MDLRTNRAALFSYPSRNVIGAIFLAIKTSSMITWAWLAKKKRWSCMCCEWHQNVTGIFTFDVKKHAVWHFPTWSSAHNLIELLDNTMKVVAETNFGAPLPTRRYDIRR